MRVCSRKGTMAEEANGRVAPRTPPKDCTWGHWTGAIGGTNLKETHQQEARWGQLAISHQGKHGPNTVLHMWSNGACA